MKIGALLTALAAATIGLADDAVGQDAGQDWEIVHRDNVVGAATQYDNGLALIVRCRNGRSLNAMITGLPAARGHTRQIATWFEGSERDERQANRPGAREPRGWGVGGNASTAFSRYPAGLARRLQEGGVMNILVPGGAEDGRNLRYVLELPESPSAMETVLNTCGRELKDPRDDEVEALGPDGLPYRIKWARQPTIQYPTGRTYVRGFVTVSCMTLPDGRLEECVLESEQPEDGGFGEAVLRAARNGRLRNEHDRRSPVPRTRILFHANFVMN